MVTTFLGDETLQLDVVEVPDPTLIGLVTNGVWGCEAELRKLFQAREQETVQHLVARCASAARDDATAVVLDLR